MLRAAMILVAALAVTALVVPAQATFIGFETSEGYDIGNVVGQPGDPPGGSQWINRNASGGNNVADGAGIGGSRGVVMGGVGYSRSAFVVGEPELGAPFNRLSSVVDYTWNVKTTGNDGNVGEFYIGSKSDMNHSAFGMRIVYYEGWKNPKIYHRPGGSASGYIDLQTAGNWDVFDLRVDWGTKKYDLTVNGSVIGTGFDFTYSYGTDDDNGNFTIQSSAAAALCSVDNITIVPEPATLSLLAVGGVLALVRRRR